MPHRIRRRPVLTPCRILSAMRSRTRTVAPAAVLAFVVAAVLGVASPAAAAPAYPRADGRCVDQTGVLGSELCATVTAVLLRDEKATSDEIAVAVVPTTDDATIEEWSTGLFNAWGVGKHDKDNGVLLVVAIDDHRVRLETGRGMAARLSDSAAAGIVDDVITPHFADDEYALGILTGLDAVRRKIGHAVPPRARLESLAKTAPAPADQDRSGGDDATAPDDVQVTSPDQSASTDDGSLPLWPIGLGALAVVALLIAFISRASSRSARSGAGTTPRRSSSLTRSTSAQYSPWTAGSIDTTSSSWSSSVSSGGSDFGGGSSDGGGASGSW
jgi:uncharacterized protein